MVIEELILELSAPGIQEKKGICRPTATARFIYKSSFGKEQVEGHQFRFVSPFGAIEREELRWYLEQYYHWPEGVFRSRAKKVETQLKEWGQALYNAAIYGGVAREVFITWGNTDENRERKFTVSLDPDPIAGNSVEKQTEAHKAATWLLGLPWELLHDNKTYLFQGLRGVQVRRSLSKHKTYETVSTTLPIRILLISPRPEDEQAAYIDHRISAHPLVESLEPLGELAELVILTPPTFPALQQELIRAKESGKPYHVVHFDGHGTYDKEVKLGGLCFEHPDDTGKLEKRRSQIIHSEELAVVLAEHHIPLFVLDACKTAQAEFIPTASVATALLSQGMASVVAMSHTVLVETARRFVKAFYTALVSGKRVGEAMLEGRQELQADSWRMNIRGAGDLYLQDWFVPILFQEDDDTQLITGLPADTKRGRRAKKCKRNLGELPDPPEYAFVGRSRELLKIERMLLQKRARYVVLNGEAGVGKTSIAVEAARWLTVSQRFRRAVFVSMENCRDAEMLLERIGRQLMSDYSVAQFAGQHQDFALFKKVFHPLARVLREHPTIIIIDSVEFILPLPTPDPSQEGKYTPPPPSKGELFTPSPSHQGREPGGSEILQGVFELCQKLLEIPETRILFTSREPLPSPFNEHEMQIGRFTKQEAIELACNIMAQNALQVKEDEAEHPPAEIEHLVETVNRHARSLALLAPEVSRSEVQGMPENLVDMMSDLHKHYPNNKEHSLFASIEHSLRRLPKETREKIGFLGVFQGGANIGVLGLMLQKMYPLSCLSVKEEKLSKNSQSPQEKKDIADEGAILARELVNTGLAEVMDYGHLRLHPALCPYLLGELKDAEKKQAKTAWTEGMESLASYLYDQQVKHGQSVTTITLLELPNLLAALKQVQQTDNPERIVSFASDLESLLETSGRPDVLAKIAAVREKAAKQLKTWGHAWFEAEANAIDRMLQSGQFRQASTAAQRLLNRSLDAGEETYTGADYDIAYAHWLLGRVLKRSGLFEKALKPLAEAEQHFRTISATESSNGAARMVSVVISDIGSCLLSLGRLNEAINAYQEVIQHSEEHRALRDAAVGKGQLGTVYMLQNRYNDALEAFQSTREIFEKLGETGSVAAIWRRIGMVCRKGGDFESAERAYKKALTICVQRKDMQGQANSLSELGNLYSNMGRLEEAVAFIRQAIDIAVYRNDLAKEGLRRSNIAALLIKLQRFDEARQEILRAIECHKPFGHAAEPWKSWNVLHNLEQALDNTEAAERARAQAMQTYTAYRRAGGEGQSPLTQLYALATKTIIEGEITEIHEKLESSLKHDGIEPGVKETLLVLQAILSGSRDPGLVQDSALNYDDVVELQLLLERLEFLGSC